MKLIAVSVFLFSSLILAQEQSQDEPKETSSAAEYRSMFGVNVNLSKGNFEFAPSTKVPVEFNTVDLTYTKIRNSNIVSSFSLEHAFNQSRTSFTSLYGGIGYKIDLSENLKTIPMVTAGFSLYKENSPTQSINTLGTLFSIKNSLIYNIKDDFGVIFNVQYSRMMFTRGYSPKDPSGEMVYVYINSGIGFFWEL